MSPIVIVNHIMVGEDPVLGAVAADDETECIGQCNAAAQVQFTALIVRNRLCADT